MKLDTVDHLDELGFFQKDFIVCDIGSGMGYIPKYTMKHKKPIWYHGFDVMLSNIKHCRNICNDIRYQFTYLPYYSDAYNPMGLLNAKDFKIKLPSGSVDSVICHSLFTHLSTEDVARSYMQEIRRVLRPGGLLWITFFSSPPNETCDGTKRTVYSMEFIETLLVGFENIKSSGGFTTDYHDQLEISCVKA